MLFLVTFFHVFLGWDVNTNQCTGLSWGQSYLWHLSVLASMLICTQMPDFPCCLWCTCIWCSVYTRCFKLCSDQNLLPVGRMSYCELGFVVFGFFFPNTCKIQSFEGRKKKSRLADTFWIFFWIWSLMFKNCCSCTHFTEPFSACCFCGVLSETAPDPEPSLKLWRSKSFLQV